VVVMVLGCKGGSEKNERVVVAWQAEAAHSPSQAQMEVHSAVNLRVTGAKAPEGRRGVAQELTRAVQHIRGDQECNATE
jgi:hypothetical protein